jgi:hypothetical protein
MWDIIFIYIKNQSVFSGLIFLYFFVCHTKKVTKKVTTGEKIKLPFSHMPSLTRAGHLNFRTARGHANTPGDI